MKNKVYNISISIGIILASVGVGLYDYRYGLIVAGFMIIALTLYNDRNDNV